MNQFSEDVFTLPEGPISLRFPNTTLSADSYREFEDWWYLVKRKIQRRVAPEVPAPEPPAAFVSMEPSPLQAVKLPDIEEPF
jgi:hypothetical protein